MEQNIKNPEISELSSYSILITGSTGFIGSRLLRYFCSKGIKVKAMSRREIPDETNVKYVKADAFKFDELSQALEGIEIAYYLLHSMEGSKENWEDFVTREKKQAQNFIKASEKAGVKRIIYLGGLVGDESELSPHMRSRKEVGEILASSNIPVTELRASIIIGAEGGSYTMLRYLVDRLRVMVCPRWVKSLAQPIAVDDVIEYLFECARHKETSGKILEIGGPIKMTYEELMRIYAAYLNKNLLIIHIPFLTTRLSSYWVDLITPVNASLARPLIDSLVHNTIVTDDSIKKIIPLEPMSIRSAIDIAEKEMAQMKPFPKQKEEKTSFVINQRILMCTLLTLAMIGTTYYWLDDRSDVYQPGWILGSFVWYGTIGFAILFVHNKTRLGYLIAGILSWVTLAFWLFDNYHVAFQMSLFSEEPNQLMTIRNFIGIVIAALAVFTSHNVFHKVQQYQKKGTPLEG